MQRYFYSPVFTSLCENILYFSLNLFLSKCYVNITTQCFPHLSSYNVSLIHITRSSGTGWRFSRPARAEVDAWGHFLEGTEIKGFGSQTNQNDDKPRRKSQLLASGWILWLWCPDCGWCTLLYSWWPKRASGTRTGPRFRPVATHRSAPPCSRLKTQRS